MLVCYRFFIIALCVFFLSCQSRPKVLPTSTSLTSEKLSASHFVIVQGAQLLLRNKSYYAVGTNFELAALARDRLSNGEGVARELDLLKASGINNLRVALLSNPGSPVTSGESNALVFLAYDQYLLHSLDLLLNEASKRDMTLVVILSLPGIWWLPDELSVEPNHPIATSLPEKVDQAFPLSGSAAFYRSEPAQVRYQELLRPLLTRINSVNGRSYKDDPTIMAWQIANPLGSVKGLYDHHYFSLYKSWIENTASFIKSLDPHHLVSVDSEGAMNFMQNIDVYRDAQGAAGVDYLTVHLWPKTWGWFDLANPEGTYRSAVAASKAYLLQHLLAAKSLNKPLILEEFGLDRDDSDAGLASGTVRRDRYYSEIFGFIEQQAELGTPLSGSNFWVWGGERKATELTAPPGEIAIRDPLSDQRLYNSVFAADQSTLKEVANHAQFMGTL